MAVRDHFEVRAKAQVRLVFTCDGVVVGVVIRSVERYDLVKMKPTESAAEHRFCLWLRRIRSNENCIVEVGSGSGRINQSQCLILGPRKYKFWRQDNRADEEQLVLWLLLIIILRRQRQYRNNIVRKRKRCWVRDIYRLRAALGEYVNLVRELRLGDREFYFR